jgi:hypothetical protein
MDNQTSHLSSARLIEVSGHLPETLSAEKRANSTTTISKTLRTEPQRQIRDSMANRASFRQVNLPFDSLSPDTVSLQGHIV